MKTKMSRLEKFWVLYDVGNSAFTLLVSTIIPIYYKNMASANGISASDSTAYLSYAISISTLIVAVLGPVLGAVADNKNRKKPLFTFFMMMGVLGCAALAIPRTWILFLAIFVIAKVGFSGSLIFYDSMLVDVTTDERMDEVSSQGYAWGYIGSCVPFVASLGLILGADAIGISGTVAMMIAFFINAAWWVVVTLPLLRNYQQKYYVEAGGTDVRGIFSRLGKVFAEIRDDKKVLWFLAAFFFYIDGVYTIIDMATAYGQALGLDSTGLLMALLVTQIVAFPCSIAFGRLSQKITSERLIIVCITAYFGIAVFAMFLHTQAQFWILAIVVGMFQGGIQALSRSYFTKIIPAGQSGEYFGLMDICGKGASFMGTTIVSVVSQMTGNVSKGVGMIAALFVAGMVFFIYSLRVEPEKKEQREELIKSKLAVTEEY